MLVGAGAAAPPLWTGTPRVVLDQVALDQPESVTERLHVHWLRRQPLVLELRIDPATLRSPQVWTDPPWRLGPRLGFERDRLHFLIWANNYDARGGRPLWWWALKARAVGAGPGPPGGPDALLPDGRPAWIDGGPRSSAPAEIAGSPVVSWESVELDRLDPVAPVDSPRADLAADQLEAVLHRDGPARVIAPAGSGKTRVLTERLRHLLQDAGLAREQVAAVAYNVKAAGEMRDRCRGLDPRIQTLNAMGYGLLREHRAEPPRVLAEIEVRRLLESLLPRLGRRVNQDPLAPYIEALGQVRQGLVDPVEVEETRDDVPGFAAAFPAYRAALERLAAVDFDEQIFATVELLLRDGEFRRRVQARHRHLLVDEFQDLTPLHVLFIRLLTAPTFDVFGVGDDDQVIYGHAGADPDFLIDFGALFPGAGAHALQVNYRCPAAVVEAAVNLLAYNRRRIAKRIVAAPEAVPALDALRIDRHPPEMGASQLAEVVSGWLAAGTAPAEIAVLTRVNALLLAPQVVLAQVGVPVAGGIGEEVMERTGVRAALAYLRLAVKPAAMTGGDIVEILRRPSRGLPPWFAERLGRRRAWSPAQLRALAENVPEKEAPKVLRLAAELEQLGRVAGRGGGTIATLRHVRDELGLGEAMAMLDGRPGAEGSSHLDDIDALITVAALQPDPGAFESWLRERLRGARRADGVNLSTIHRAKGREFDRVLIFGVNEGLLPHRLAVDEEEERRVLHVAITRARVEARLLVDRSRPSPFLDELSGRAPTRPARLAPTTTPAGGRSRGSGNPGRRTSGAEVEPTELSPEQLRLEVALRAWRVRRSRVDGVPAFVILSDRHLRGIAAARPLTLVELARLPGIGPAKLELYGEEIVEVVASG